MNAGMEKPPQRLRATLSAALRVFSIVLVLTVLLLAAIPVQADDSVNIKTGLYENEPEFFTSDAGPGTGPGITLLNSSSLPGWVYWIIGGAVFLAAAHLIGSMIVRKQLARRTKLLTEEIKERQKASQLMMESEAKFSVAFRSSPDIIAITSFPEGRYIDVNENFTRLTGYKREELIGRRIRDIGLWPDSSERDRWRAILEEQHKISNEEFRYRMKSGEIRTWLHSVEPIVISGETCLMAVSQDITELKKQQQMEKDENQILEMLWHQTDMLQILENIIRLGERFNPEVKGAIFLTEDSGKTLKLVAAPSLPEQYREIMKREWPIGPSSGSSGTAAHRKEAVLVPDIRNSAIFPEGDAMIRMGIIASFSQPILSSDGEHGLFQETHRQN